MRVDYPKQKFVKSLASFDIPTGHWAIDDHNINHVTLKDIMCFPIFTDVLPITIGISQHYVIHAHFTQKN